MTFQFELQVVDTVAEGFEVAHVKNLRTDMEVQSYHFYVRHLLRRLNYTNHVAHVYAKLVFCQTCGDVGMCMCSYIRIQAECNASRLSTLLSQLIDDF